LPSSTFHAGDHVRSEPNRRFGIGGDTIEIRSPMELKLIIRLLLISIWSGGTAFAGSTQGTCPGGSMNATQYSSGASTASGEPFRPDGLTAAHRSLPFGTKIRVGNPLTGATVVVIVNDRGPFTRGREIDLSRGAARAIGLADVGKVCAEIL
jgi:rare lipoprotein A